jgi:hypothetical protein
MKIKANNDMRKREATLTYSTLTTKSADMSDRSIGSGVVNDAPNFMFTCEGFNARACID